MNLDLPQRRAAAASFVIVAIIAIAGLLASSAQSATGRADDRSAAPFTLAVIGDTPYGATQIANFPQDIAEINADPRVRGVVHVGDIKNGSSLCSDSYFALIRSHFDTFKDPVVYTPGDNEWTDCYRTNNGSYVPTERLDAIRNVFFDEPGTTMGQRSKVVNAQAAPFVENVRWSQSRTVFGTIHVVGSNNNLVPWFGAPTASAAQLGEVAAREAAALEWIDTVFDQADAESAAAVVLAMQADMWDPSAQAVNQISGFDTIVQRIADRASEFERPVLLLQGDSHEYVADQPLASGSPMHGVTTAAPNVWRVVVQGASSVPHEWLRVQIDPLSKAVFTWKRVPFTS
ncbi:MAG: hypothetical protein WAP35_06305 [Solirubrobacterales bacterium]